MSGGWRELESAEVPALPAPEQNLLPQPEVAR
jgi:hypothetical protein